MNQKLVPVESLVLGHGSLRLTMIVLRGQSQTKFLRSLDTSMWCFPVELVGCLRYITSAQGLAGNLFGLFRDGVHDL